MKGIQGTTSTGVLCAIIVLALILLTIAPMAAYAVDNPLWIAVRQVFTTTSASADSNFTYRLTPLASDNPMPPGSTANGYTFTVSGTSSAQIAPISYSKQGVYKYELYQLIGAERPGYTYDRWVYVIEVHVDAALEAKIIVKNQDGAKVDEIRFRNSYSILPSDPRLMVDPPVRKTVSGYPSRDSAFTFRLTAQNAANPMPAGSVNGVKNITIIGSGEGEFGVWSYNKEGVYYYSVSEVDFGESGYIYDTAVYTITDIVREENGRLVLSRAVTNAYNKPVTSLGFINSYKYGGSGGPGGSGGSGWPGGPGGTGGSGWPGDKIVNPPYGITNIGDPQVPLTNKPNGIDVPKTGDNLATGLFTALLVLGILLTTGATVYLLSGRR
jgi:pilin isopeptide linkage protein